MKNSILFFILTGLILSACKKDCTDNAEFAPLPVYFKIVDENGNNLIQSKKPDIQAFFFNKGTKRDISLSTDSIQGGYVIGSPEFTMASDKITQQFYLQLGSDIDTLTIDAKYLSTPCGTIGGGFRVNRILFNNTPVAKVKDGSWGHYPLVKKSTAVIGGK